MSIKPNVPAASMVVETGFPVSIKSYYFDPTYNCDLVEVDYTETVLIEFAFDNGRPVTRVFPLDESGAIAGACVAEVGGHNGPAALAKLAALNETI